MTLELMVDGAYPPGPGEWVEDMKSIGAKVGAFYAVGPIVNYTPDHVAAAQENDLLTLPIIVPGNLIADAVNHVRTVEAFGSTSRAIAYDTETGSLPPLGQLLGAYTAARALGHKPGQYGQQSNLDRYASIGPDWRWLAAWILTGKWQPVPAATPGDAAHQYANDVVIGHGVYDVSIIETDVLEVGMDPEARGWLANLYEELGVGPNGVTENGVADIIMKRTAAALDEIKAVTTRLDAIQTGDPVAIADALAANQQFATTLAQAIVKLMGEDLSK